MDMKIMAGRYRIDCDANELAGYLYLHLGEQMPPEAEHPEMDNALIEAWATSTDAFSIDIADVERFLVDVQQLVIDLMDEEDSDNYMVHFYDAAKRTFNGDKTKIRTWFTWLYVVMFQRPEGPRWGDFVQIYGVGNFVEQVRIRFFEIAAYGVRQHA